ncbi:MAG: hydroxyisourate hydrolase [Alphaproteobacteria bacterium]|nr:hydroxyisourate hydrolase [Alphaproteobacteria bacterium]MDE2336367.1 hydroxyisourate hydrolase [Alphaproteobacteria bacterium]
MGKLTTHVLDTANGCPAKGMALCLYRGSKLLLKAKTDADGRVAAPLLEGGALKAGKYRLEFGVSAYFKASGAKLPKTPFLDVVTIDFGIADAKAHYHVPLLVSPYGYSTYRGS